MTNRPTWQPGDKKVTDRHAADALKHTNKPQAPIHDGMHDPNDTPNQAKK